VINNNDDFLDIFEQKLCDYTGAPYAVVVDRCTNAILLSLKYLNITSVSIPRWTYPSVPMTCINYGIDVTFNDDQWVGGYQLKGSNVYDRAVSFARDMYRPGQVQCLSFQQKKRLAIGKGGAILLDDADMYQTLRRMRCDGRDSRIHISQENPDNIIMGYHMNMSPDEAAKGILLLNQLSEDYTVGSAFDYPDISEWRCFND
jgi:dTDP-4-amino-4,6-dideoxygalactose transaminase